MGREKPGEPDIPRLLSKGINFAHVFQPFQGEDEPTLPFGEKERQEIGESLKKEGIPLYCGEFGVHQPYAPVESRARWLSDLTSLLEENKVGWAMWSYSGNFGLVDDQGRLIPQVVKGLGLKSDP